MTSITIATFIPLTESEDRTDEDRQAQDYLHAKERAVDEMVSTVPRILGSTRLARLLGVSARLHREISL